MTRPTPAPHVVVTGASGALGRATVEHFVNQGARLALLDRDAARANAAFPGIDTSRHLLLEADVTSEVSTSAAAEEILRVFGHVDVLIHLAGGFEMGDATHATSRRVWDRMMTVNAWSFVAVTQALVPSMLERRSGRVIAVSAKTASRGAARMAAYIASKSALQRLVESMAAELGPQGIGVNSVAPGVLDTPANRQDMPDGNFDDWVSTRDAAQAIAFLASPAAAALSGQHLVLDA